MPLVLTLISFGIDLWLKSELKPIQVLKLQLGAPVLSIDPRLYDDWSSVFVGNHIYPRLLPDESRPWIPHIAKDLNITCENSAAGGSKVKCDDFVVEFGIHEFVDCLGRRLSRDDLKAEIGGILGKKNWIFPKWSFCDSSESHICIRVGDIGDVKRRLQNIYFRFGWSKRRDGDLRFGVAPYCLDVSQEDGSIGSGRLNPRLDLMSAVELPPIVFFTSTAAINDFSAALYGAEEFLRGARKNVRAHTPLAYYLISNRKWSQFSVPWLDQVTLDIMRDHLISAGLVYEANMDVLSKMVPLGSVSSSGKPLSKSTRASVYLPDYIPSCKQLASKLAEKWRSDYPNLEFSCVDISAAVRDHIHSKNSGFGAVLTPLSPGAPGRDAIRYQYFSPQSSESLTRDFPNPEELFRLLGMGDSLVTVDGESLCGLKGQSLGLGDVFVTDFLKCR